MSDTTTISQEERAELRRILSMGTSSVDGCGLFYRETPRLLNALEQAEARAEKAESDKAALEEDLEAAEKNLKESSGFIEELLSGLKHRFPVQYAAIEGDEYGDDAFSSHDLFEFVIDPAVNAAQEAEAENTRLTKMVDFMAQQMADVYSTDEDGRYVLTCPVRTLRAADHNCDKISCPQCWAEAARRAVAAGEE